MGKDFYSYSLDIYDQYSDSVEQELSTDMLRRRWIVNAYYGIIPTLTWIKSPFRIDIGGEIRSYTGDHFGEITDFSDSALASIMDNRWYEYYRYVGEKTSATIFAHLSYKPTNWLRLIGDLQYQFHHWTLDQEKTGHAVGHNISADWKFLNPRMGAIFSLADNLSIFVNYGKGQKEPADDQIINADDVWSEPVMAAAEVIHNYEIGGCYRKDKLNTNFNLYWINYDNEQLKNIDIEQEGEYDYYAADATIHKGIEFDLKYQINSSIVFDLNGSFSKHVIISGSDKDKFLLNVPFTLLNGAVRIKPLSYFNIFINFRYVGKQYI
ncbi:MAG: TonB-dependent receptor, partial [Candidatus Marinimicrobia bacterium]|nr:TonB-dependent receptor [Candidatus Neomarinimicrobiota bacterium]